MKGNTGKYVMFLAIFAVMVSAVLLKLGESKTPGNQGKIFAELNPGLVNKIVIKKSGQSVTISREGNRFKIVEKTGYFADPVKLKELLYGLAEITLVDRLTDDPAKYPKLGLGAEPENGELWLFDGEGKEMLRFYVGATRQGPSQTASTAETPLGQFVRMEGDPSVYITKSQVKLDANPQNWLDKNLLDVASKTVTSVKVETDERGGNFWAQKSPDGDFFYKPQGEKLTKEQAERLGGVLSKILVKDVQPIEIADKIGFKPISVVEVATDDGAVYKIRLGKVGEKFYAAFALTGGKDESLKELSKWLFETQGFVYERMLVSRNKLNAR